MPTAAEPEQKIARRCPRIEDEEGGRYPTIGERGKRNGEATGRARGASGAEGDGRESGIFSWGSVSKVVGGKGLAGGPPRPPSAPPRARCARPWPPAHAPLPLMATLSETRADLPGTPESKARSC